MDNGQCNLRPMSMSFTVHRRWDLAVNLEEIEKQLESFKKQVQFATDNLIELSEMPIYKRCRGEAGWPRPAFTGMTQERVAFALEAIDGIWQRLPELNEILK